VVSPPKIIGAMSPAFCATSVKCAIGFAFVLSDLAALGLGEFADCMESQAQSAKKQRSRREEKWRIIGL